MQWQKPSGSLATAPSKSSSTPFQWQTPVAAGRAGSHGRSRSRRAAPLLPGSNSWHRPNPECRSGSQGATGSARGATDRPAERSEAVSSWMRPGEKALEVAGRAPARQGQLARGPLPAQTERPSWAFPGTSETVGASLGCGSFDRPQADLRTDVLTIGSHCASSGGNTTVYAKHGKDPRRLRRVLSGEASGCSCKRRCHTTIQLEQLQQLCNAFWGLSSEEQAYLVCFPGLSDFLLHVCCLLQLANYRELQASQRKQQRSIQGLHAILRGGH